jgi:hypothetical protein
MELQVVDRVNAAASMLHAVQLGQSDAAEVRMLVVVSVVLAGVSLLGMLGLALVALMRARPEDIPAVVSALTPWWRKGHARRAPGGR